MINKELKQIDLVKNQESKRLIAIDIVRGLAVVGMYVQHFALNQVNRFVSGNTMILFILCSGISYTLMTQRMMECEVEVSVFRAKILARAIFIDLVGYILIMLNGPFAVVLPAFAMLFLIMLPLIHYSAGQLLKVSCILFLISPPLMIIGLSLFSGIDLLSDIAGGPLSALAWAPVFVAGMAIGHFNLHKTSTALKLIVSGFILLIPTKLVSIFFLPTWQQSFEKWLLKFSGIANPQVYENAIWPFNTQPIQWQMLFIEAPQCGSAFELIIGTGIGIIIIGIICLISKRNLKILEPFISTGRVALTLYSLQFIIVWGIQLMGIDSTNIDLGGLLFGDILVILCTISLGYLIDKKSKPPVEYSLRQFERFFSRI